MNIFITGATGYIGGSLAARLLGKGHVVRGLVRTQEKAHQLLELGIEPILGDLDDAALLKRAAGEADAVINAADSDHRGAITALLDALEGSGKAFIHTSGAGKMADDAAGAFCTDVIYDEYTPYSPLPERVSRHALDVSIQDSAARGIRAMVVCPALIYGHGLGLARDSVQLPMLLKYAKAHGTVGMVGDGKNVWSNVHLEDLLDLYELALEKGPAGAFFFGENGEASFEQMGAAIARRFNLPGPSTWDQDQATRELGSYLAVKSLGVNSRVRATRARAELKWAPVHGSVLQWIEREM